jgi:hypothetical protein
MVTLGPMAHATLVFIIKRCWKFQAIFCLKHFMKKMFWEIATLIVYAKYYVANIPKMYKYLFIL